jgi:protein SCO1
VTARYVACGGLAVAALTVAACGSTSSSPGTTGVPKGRTEVKLAKYAGTAAVPRGPAPPLALRDYRGRLVNLRQFRGKAVFVTFVYTHCPDVCPLIVGHLRAALGRLGPEAKKVQIVAVSTDPRGDTRGTVRPFLREHQMHGRMDYLLGSERALEHVWAAWHITAKPAPAGRDLVEHSALIYGISASGTLTTLYPASFAPEQIVHDAPILASQ